MTECRCGSGNPYSECCEPFHLGSAFPQTAEQLMRSRYTAYALLLKDYLLSTWAESTRPAELSFENGLAWTQLEIVQTRQGRAKDKRGWVTFRAHYQIGLDHGVMEEVSRFERDAQGHWVYVSGEVREPS